MKYFKTVEKDKKIIVNCYGRWDINTAEKLQKEVDTVLSKIQAFDDIVLNLEGVDSIDTSGAVLFSELLKRLGKSNVSIEYKDDKQKELIELVFRTDADITVKNAKSKTRELNLVQKIGKYFLSFFSDFLLFVDFIGECSLAFAAYLLHPSKIRWKAIVKGIENAGVSAIPIVALTSFLVGVVIAYQSAVQLQKFGANIFIVDMIGISVTRELAPLITAIVVAGRSGSSYTAQIGAQKITRELDAMKTMGFNLFEFLVLPRIIALVIALPLLIFFADLVGIFGGMVVAKYQVEISYVEFLKRLQSVLPLRHLWIGLAKGPFFAVLIASIGCFRGFQVSSNTESIGKYTTISVVNSIFLVIACDALFSIIFTSLGI
ncbi:MAG: MlaE family lipid ABC transporter permease subunit [Epsilonproteobacteria bacterium]|nr:MlaE family lipid ABC transporter permease subunit [Campylobacterota bacterium]